MNKQYSLQSPFIGVNPNFQRLQIIPSPSPSPQFLQSHQPQRILPITSPLLYYPFHQPLNQSYQRYYQQPQTHYQTQQQQTQPQTQQQQTQPQTQHNNKINYCSSKIKLLYVVFKRDGVNVCELIQDIKQIKNYQNLYSNISLYYVIFILYSNDYNFNIMGNFYKHLDYIFSNLKQLFLKYILSGVNDKYDTKIFNKMVEFLISLNIQNKYYFGKINDINNFYNLIIPDNQNNQDNDKSKILPLPSIDTIEKNELFENEISKNELSETEEETDNEVERNKEMKHNNDIRKKKKYKKSYIIKTTKPLDKDGKPINFILNESGYNLRKHQ